MKKGCIKSAGFTLVELIVVIAVLCILAFVVVYAIDEPDQSRTPKREKSIKCDSIKVDADSTVIIGPDSHCITTK